MSRHPRAARRAERPAGPGLALETATGHVELLAIDAAGEPVAHVVEDVEHGHTRRLAPLVAETLSQAGLSAHELAWVAADLGPGSFTGVRVGLATAAALSLAAADRAARPARLGASSLAALALGAPPAPGLLVPLVPAGRRDAYAGFFRCDARGDVHLVAAPRVGPTRDLLEAVRETRAIVGLGGARARGVRFVGPAVPREREALEEAWPGSTATPWRWEGLSAVDLAAAATSPRGPAAGLPGETARTTPVYVRPAQAEARVRHAASPAAAVRLRPFRAEDLPQVVAMEHAIFTDPWPASFFLGELEQAMSWARIAERDGAIAGYLVAWLGAGTGHLGNLAVIPAARRRGVARVLLVDLFERARQREVTQITLEVRVSNAPAQALYRAHGFRLAGLRRGYYRDTGEDALIMEWRDPAAARALPRQDASPASRSESS